jgi:hypothetical protein
MHKLELKHARAEVRLIDNSNESRMSQSMPGHKKLRAVTSDDVPKIHDEHTLKRILFIQRHKKNWQTTCRIYLIYTQCPPKMRSLFLPLISPTKMTYMYTREQQDSVVVVRTSSGTSIKKCPN